MGGTHLVISIKLKKLRRFLEYILSFMVIKIIKEFIEFLGDFLGKEDTLSRIGVSQIG